MLSDHPKTDGKRRKTNLFPGGGEMGTLTRSYDWASTPLGPIERWPQSLKTIVDVVLHAQVPMILWWGDEFIQVYNDAFRSDLISQGKHPGALGQRAEECWPEIWPIVKPLIDEVRAGGAVWRRNDMIPIYRHGKIEEVYWTFGYSPVRNDQGNIQGVLAISNESTEEVRTVERLELKERTLRSVIDLAPVGICILDRDSLQPEMVNDIMLQTSSKTREEFLTHSLWELFPDLREPYASLLESVSRTGEAYMGHEHRLVFQHNGANTVVYLDIVVKPLDTGRTRSGGKLMVMVIDVTDKVLARKKIQESERRFKMLITESTVAIALYTGPELRIQYVNEIMTKYWGKDLSVIGKTLAEAIPEIEGQPFLQQLANVYKTGATYVGTEAEAILRVDGRLQTFYFNYIFKALKDGEGSIYGIHHMAMDVTDQVVARKRLEQSEATLRNMVLNAPVAMCILRGPTFVVEIANDPMFTLWGKRREQVVNRPIFEGLPEVSHQGFEEILQHVYATGESFSAEAVPIKLPRKGRLETIFATFLYEPYRSSGEDISGVLVVATDITEQVKARQRVEELVAERTRELAESNKNLQRSNEELAQFAYIASHDLQEPARKISTFTEMLQRSLRDADPRSRSLLNKIENSATRMLSLIRGVLAYSQLSNATQTMTRIDLNDVVSAVLEDFELRIKETNATIESAALPVIMGIPVQVGQLFGNLISNALKFSSKVRAPHITISSTTIATEKGVRYHRISIRDNGIGFNQQHARQIFDIFQRLHGQADYEGTGVGLAMCKKIAQNHNGDITAEATEGKGSVFHVFLPA